MSPSRSSCSRSPSSSESRRVSSDSSVPSELVSPRRSVLLLSSLTKITSVSLVELLRFHEKPVLTKEQEKLDAENRNFILQCTRSILNHIKTSFLFTIVNHFFCVFIMFLLHFLWQFLALLLGWRGQLPRYIPLFFFTARTLRRTGVTPNQ